MGPRSRDRGNPWLAHPVIVDGFWLQWGRDHVIAEINDNGVTIPSIWSLQWGRDHVIAEMPYRLN